MSATYRAKGPPANVIIHREGVVRLIHAGFNPQAIARMMIELTMP